MDLELPDGDGSQIVSELKRRMQGALVSVREGVEEAGRQLGAEEAMRRDRPLPEILSALKRLPWSGREVS